MAELATRVAREARVARMLEARSVAVVGASDRPGSFGWRLATEALRSPGIDEVHLIHPTRATVLGRRCLPSLAMVPEPVDLVLLGVPDSSLVEQVSLAAARGDAGAVAFGGAVGLGDALRSAAGDLVLCGAGCMGFVNVASGVRAIGYLERAQLPVGGISLITHSGSVFSALLRTHRRLEFGLAVSSGQELMTSTADYLAYALRQAETTVVGLFLETLRDVAAFRDCLRTAAESDIPIVALTVGRSTSGRELVSAHSGALAGDDAGWEALFAAYGVHRATDFADLVDSLELFSIGRRASRSLRGKGIATLHDSGGERALVADIAADVGVEFAPLKDRTRDGLAALLGPGLAPDNPLDVWSTGADTAALFADCMRVLADDDEVGAVALAVDLVAEYDGDGSYLEAVEAAVATIDKPIVVLANVAAAVDQLSAQRLRAQGVPVLEGTRSALRALKYSLTPEPRIPGPFEVDAARRDRWLARLGSGLLRQADCMELLADYGIGVARTLPADSSVAAVETAERLGYPVVLKTDEPTVAHKLSAGGVRLGLVDGEAVTVAYREVAQRHGAAVVVQPQLPQGLELCFGIVQDPLVGPLALAALGGTQVELLGERRMALPPLDLATAEALIAGLPGASDAACAAAPIFVAVSQLAVELGCAFRALDVNPVIVSGDRAVAVDALLVQ